MRAPETLDIYEREQGETLLMDLARSGERVSLPVALDRIKHLRQSPALERYIEADLVSSRKPFYRAIWLTLRYPDLEQNISLVAADFSYWHVRVWARRLRIWSLLTAGLFGGGILLLSGVLRVTEAEHRATVAEERAATAERDAATTVESTGTVIRAQLQQFELELARKVAEKHDLRVASESDGPEASASPQGEPLHEVQQRGNPSIGIIEGDG